jgi:hypothetical protein
MKKLTERKNLITALIFGVSISSFVYFNGIYASCPMITDPSTILKLEDKMMDEENDHSKWSVLPDLSALQKVVRLIEKLSRH